ncbi:HlyD family secretion protein [Mannheimia haemolytica]|nr:HlyD family efflux transporter periplasmic adaptor subunit [Mannheimia haemolytica]EPY99231.1 secretion permease [Mannheimia haemolytica D35]MDW1150380.1 HlyD family efflux transporter periplasmic adaptor subunit [Mannheimia haemolytica]MDW1160591.1 HlyD family efflux transporter periplasmic adaptor subunit [Mannheimia haemolytica]MEE3700070.1 HlyD family efflux transporter periplasmic adaptor subunit [Mannheimia haemolytica]
MFRKEAIAYQSKKWKSTAVLFSRIPAWFVFLISFFIFAAFILFIVFGSYTRRETVVGELVMQAHPIILSAPKSGYISENYIQPHQQVKKGDPLFKITLDRITHSGNINVNSILSLKSQIQATEQAITALYKNKSETINSLEKQIKNNQKIYQDKQSYLVEIEKSMNDYADLVKRYEKLLKVGHSSHDEVNIQKSRYFQQKSLFNELKQELIQLKSSQLNLENEIETRKTEFDNQIIRYEMQKSDLSIRLMEFESVSEIIVNASVDGKIESTSVTVGQIIKENDPLAQILPQNKGDYQLVMWVPNSAISFIKQGDEVNIRYEAFPFEKFGQFKGKITSISTLPASLQELSFYKNLPANLEQGIPLYKILIELADQNVKYNDTTLYFMSGMKAEATLFLEKRKLYEWILFPMYQLSKNMEQ